MTETLRPKSTRWEQFGNELGRALTIPNTDSSERRCGQNDGGAPLRFTRQVLRYMGNVDVDGTLAYCEQRATAECDCMLLFTLFAQHDKATGGVL